MDDLLDRKRNEDSWNACPITIIRPCPYHILNVQKFKNKWMKMYTCTGILPSVTDQSLFTYINATNTDS